MPKPTVNLKSVVSAGREMAVIVDADGAPTPVALAMRPSNSSPSRHRAILVAEVAPNAVAQIIDMRLEMN